MPGRSRSTPECFSIDSTVIMPRIAKNPLLRSIFHLLTLLAWGSLAGCQLIPGFGPTYAPTPTFPPIPQPSATFTPTSAPTLTPAPPPVIVSRQKQEDDPGHYTIKINYPSLEGAADPRFQLFNQEVDKIVVQVTQDFKNNAQAGDATPDPNFTGNFQETDYSIKYGEHGLISVLFTVNFYISGAAHPNQFFVTLNLDIGKGKVLALKDLFKPGADYLKFISDYAIQDLTRQGRLEFEAGAAAKEENFHSWNITPDGLLLSFDPYQVASYAAGPQSVTIPYSAMKATIDPSGPLLSVFQ
jgi:hypothetical protein